MYKAVLTLKEIDLIMQTTNYRFLTVNIFLKKILKMVKGF